MPFLLRHPQTGQVVRVKSPRSADFYPGFEVWDGEAPLPERTPKNTAKKAAARKNVAPEADAKETSVEAPASDEPTE